MKLFINACVRHTNGNRTSRKHTFARKSPVISLAIFLNSLLIGAAAFSTPALAHIKKESLNQLGSVLPVAAVSNSSGASEDSSPNVSITSTSSGLPSPYVVKSGYDFNFTLSFIFGDQPSGQENVNWWKIEPEYTDTHHPGWIESDAHQAKKVIIDEGFKAYKPTSTAFWFWGMACLEDIEGLKNLDTHYTKNMYQMFFLCLSLRSLDLSCYITDWDVNTDEMFEGCYGLSSITLSRRFILMSGTKLPGLEYCGEDFWIVDMKTEVSYNKSESASRFAIEDVLKARGTQTFTKAKLRLIYDANGGQFGDESSPAGTVAYLYGNEDDVISGVDASGQPFDYTPIPTRADYTYLGYSPISSDKKTSTPTKFPMFNNITYYAVYEQNDSLTRDSSLEKDFSLPDMRLFLILMSQRHHPVHSIATSCL